MAANPRLFVIGRHKWCVTLLILSSISPQPYRKFTLTHLVDGPSIITHDPGVDRGSSKMHSPTSLRGNPTDLTNTFAHSSQKTATVQATKKITPSVLSVPHWVGLQKEGGIEMLSEKRVRQRNYEAEC
ncbi:hypothetical protein K443DRAFT_358622 [Laccaria amethystina LaAM-08-1]|uniref:Uncharacterized protein n=1 Tax=Laccaria amethystina LaAM-08-1 TaxID=1095629 RepID=A0A0C9WS69_9AGAR|nr:hypothetical protein K443DRAFT_358622 [Laccaria amethystina LaAM-08-1]